MRMSIVEWSDIESEQINCPVVKMKRVMMRTSLPGNFVGWREAAGLVYRKEALKKSIYNFSIN